MFKGMSSLTQKIPARNLLVVVAVTKSCPRLSDPMDYSTSGFPVLHYLLEFAQTHVHWVDHAIQPSHPLSIPSPYPLSLFQHQGLFNELALHIRWPKYWSFSPSNEYSGFISFRIHWFDLFAVQGTFKSLLQHHTQFKSINSSVLSLLYGPTLTSVHDY